MSEDALELALKYSDDHNKALGSDPNVLRNAIGCVVCNCIMVEPYVIECGHGFCRKCLLSWTEERTENSTCPTCRALIDQKPVFCLALRQLALAVIESYNSDPHTQKKVPPESLEMGEEPQFLNRANVGAPIFDAEDQIYRCAQCNHEIDDDGLCTGCGLYFESRNTNMMSQSDDDDNSLYNHDSETALALGDIFFGLRSRRLHEPRPRRLHEGQDLDASTDDESEEDISGESDNWRANTSDIEFEEEDGEGSIHEEAQDTSDDSLLEEKREHADESDVEVTDVRHRAIIDDDDDE